MLAFLGIAVLAAGCFVGWRWGGRDEQLAAFGFAVATAASNLANEHLYTATETGVLAVDVMLMAGLLILALTSDRFWPLWASAFHFVALLVHIGSLTQQGNFAWAYAIGLIFWSYAVIASLIVGTFLEGHSRRLATQ
jgi:hypothetical protein